jgi:hypothetical protein
MIFSFLLSPTLSVFADLLRRYQCPLSDVQDIYPNANFPKNNPFFQDLETLLIEKFWQS